MAHPAFSCFTCPAPATRATTAKAAIIAANRTVASVELERLETMPTADDLQELPESRDEAGEHDLRPSVGRRDLIDHLQAASVAEGRGDALTIVPRGESRASRARAPRRARPRRAASARGRRASPSGSSRRRVIRIVTATTRVSSNTTPPARALDANRNSALATAARAIATRLTQRRPSLSHRAPKNRSAEIAATVPNGTCDGRERGISRCRVAAHDDVGVAVLLEVRIEDRLAGCAPACAGTLENQLFSTKPVDEMLY